MSLVANRLLLQTVALGTYLAYNIHTIAAAAFGNKRNKTFPAALPAGEQVGCGTAAAEEQIDSPLSPKKNGVGPLYIQVQGNRMRVFLLSLEPLNTIYHFIYNSPEEDSPHNQDYSSTFLQQQVANNSGGGSIP